MSSSVTSSSATGTVAQRRGNKNYSNRPEPTILVESADGVLMRGDAGRHNQQLPLSTTPLSSGHGVGGGGGKRTNTNNNGAGTSSSIGAAGNNGATTNIAVVRRRFCGTGPFDKHWLNLDCCGLVCAVFTYGLLLYGVYAVCFVLIPPWMSYRGVDNVRFLSAFGLIHRTIFTAFTMMAMASHFKAMTTDPGAVPPDAKPLPEPDDDVTAAGKDKTDEAGAFVNNGAGGDTTTREPLLVTPPQLKRPPLRLCRRCKAFKPQRAHHCSICRRCIIKMDHHCPWVNNCVGLGNHKYFLLFVFYTFVVCCYALILVITRFSTCMGFRSHTAGQPRQHVSCLDQPIDLLKILGLLIEAILFGMFTSCMMFDQCDVIHSKVTHIDRLKGADVGGALAGITEVFGIGNVSRRGGGSGGTSSSSVQDDFTKFRPDWLSPFARVCFPESLQDEVFGFCRPVLRGCGSGSSTSAISKREVEMGSGGNSSSIHSKTLADNV